MSGWVMRIRDALLRGRALSRSLRRNQRAADALDAAVKELLSQ